MLFLPARHAAVVLLLVALALVGCDQQPRSANGSAAEPADEPSPHFRNVATATAYVGDSACTGCHAQAAAMYQKHGMARSFHPWTPEVRIERPLDSAITHRRSGLQYAVVEDSGRLYQVEFIAGPDGRRLHELRRRMDYVMGSGHIARSYFTAENGRLFQLPLTWYRDHGWDFSPGYEINNARFERLLPDRCVACHASYPRPFARMEGKYAELRPGIGCERCHGPGALHVAERRAGGPRALAASDSGFDRTIVNPARLPLERRLDVCEQCHVHTPVTVQREGRGAFDYVPSQPLRDHFAYFKVAGSIDLVSHADRLRQSACFLATKATARPLECASCHDLHQPPPDARARNQPCASCHASATLAQQLPPAARPSHAAGADCVSCHMPPLREHTVPHGTFTDHWIRVPGRDAPSATRPARGGAPIEPYYARDRAGPESELYRSMGTVVFASRANSARTLRGAAAALERALDDRDDGARRPQARMLLGVAYEQLGRTGDAIGALESSVAADSANPEALRALAQAYDRAGRPPASVDALYARALALQPALAWIRAEYGDLLQAQGLTARAVAEYRSALAEQPSLAAAWFNLGTALASDGQLAPSSEAFQRAVRLDPALGQALSPLLEVTAAGGRVTGVRGLGSPLPSLLGREGRPGALQVQVGGGAQLLFVNTPARGMVQILKPDGTPVHVLPTDGRGATGWDLRTASGRPVGGGLFRAVVQGRDASGRPVPPQSVLFGVVRKGGG